MKSVRVAIAFVVLAVLVGAVFAQPSPENDLETYLDPEALRDLMLDPPEAFYLVDVRTPAEYKSGHIPGSVNVELAIIADQPPTDDTDASIVVYCRSGNRSAQAAAVLSSLGYTSVLDWGGIGRWPFELIMGGEPR